jgi:hypothetical protein
MNAMAAGLFSEQIVPKRLCLGEDMLPGQRNAAGADARSEVDRHRMLIVGRRSRPGARSRTGDRHPGGRQ